MPLLPPRSLTNDTFFNGRLKISQEGIGYRYSLDAVLLAYYAAPRKEDRIIDLGTGCGVISLLMAYRYPKIKIYGVEIQKELARIADLNARQNRLKDRIIIICQDMLALRADQISGPVDLVVCNPPYRRAASGRINPDSQRAVARHEIKITLAGVIDTARRTLRTAGRFVIIYPVERLADLIEALRKKGLEPKSLCMIHSDSKSRAKLILLEAVSQGRPGLKADSPIYIYKDNGCYSTEMQKMFEP